jgi:enolase
MKSPKSKQDLIETVYKQIELDVHCGEVEAIEELLTFLPIVNLIEYLPEEDWKQFKHLRDATTT